MGTLDSCASCPFCGTNTGFTVQDEEHTGLHFVECPLCRARGPADETRDKAVDIWNWRARLSEAGARPPGGAAKA